MSAVRAVVMTPSHKRGFTLIEVVIVVAVIGALGMIALRNVATVRVATALNEATVTIVNAAEQARQYSASGREFGSGLFPGYGVSFDINQPRDVTIFADCVLDDTGDDLISTADDFTYDPAGTDCGGVAGLVDTVRISLNPQVVIRDVRAVLNSPVSQPQASVLYVRPDPTTWVAQGDGSILPYGRIEVVVGDVDGTRERVIRLWTSGLIDAE